MFVNQLYEDKSLALHAREPPNSELLLINSLLDLIYFLKYSSKNDIYPLLHGLFLDQDIIFYF